jgi:Protein of unknown function (DUF3040)
VPLSEHEQRLFEQIERSLAEDPKFASAVRASDPRFHARRRFWIAGVLVVAGLALVVYGAVSKSALVGVAGFVVMLGAAGFALTSLRRSQGNELRSVDGTASRSTRRRSSLIDRLEERWRQRPEDGRQ